MNSLRRTALLWMALLLALVGTVAVLISFFYAHSEAADFLDGQQRQIALNAGEGLRKTLPPPAKQDPEDAFSILIWDADGLQIHDSLPQVHVPRQSREGFSDILIGGQRWRVYLATDGFKTIQVAQRSEVRDELARAAAIEVAAPLLIVIPLSWVVVGWAMNRVLGRLDVLARQLMERSAATNAAIPLEGIPLEVAPLVKGMNSLMARLRAAFELQRRFLADAAHELRTPLAAIQIQAEGLGSDDDDRKAAIASGVRRASGLVTQLLRLARLDDPQLAASNETIELLPLLLGCVADYVETACRKGVDIGVVQRDLATFRGSPAELRVLLENLIDNAVRYTPEGGTVDVALRREGDKAVIEIVDTGPGIPPDAEGRIFDRFFRAAPAGIEGTGLGLAIVKRIAERNGIAVAVTNRADNARGTRARIEMPLAIVA